MSKKFYTAKISQLAAIRAPEKIGQKCLSSAGSNQCQDTVAKPYKYRFSSLSKKYFFNIRPWDLCYNVIHMFITDTTFIIIMLGLLYCGESFSIINMIRFVIISSSDEQACKLLPHPKMYYMCIQVTRLKESSINLILSMCCWLEWCRRQNLLLLSQLLRLSLFFPHLLLRCHTSANSRRTSV